MYGQCHQHIHLVCRTLNNNNRITILDESQNEEDVLVTDIPKDEDLMLEKSIIREVSVEKKRV